MPFSPDDVDIRLAARIKSEREARGWSLADLAEHSGVSRSMINKVERHQSSPTSALLARIANAFGMTMSTLLIRAEGAAERAGPLRADQRQRWVDPDTGYVRSQIFLAEGSDFPVDVVEVTMPAGQCVDYPAISYTFTHHAVLVLSGCLTLTLGESEHVLASGDSIKFGTPGHCTYENRGAEPCTYLVIVAR